jgi:hypothetical protein
MDFITTHAPPFAITINGKRYDVPRFLLAQFKVWAVNRQKAIQDTAISVYQDADARARFLLYHQPPPLDLAWVAQQLTTAEGAEHVVRVCLVAAKVPPDDITGLIENSDPMLIRKLADELRSGNGMISEQLSGSGDAGTAGNPPTGQSPTSAD